MPTAKHRINVTVTEEMEQMIITLARREHVPEATKASQLLRIALDLEEDAVLSSLAGARAKKKATYIPHQEAWN